MAATIKTANILDKRFIFFFSFLFLNELTTLLPIDGFCHHLLLVINSF
jgi:hypothetical protein